MSHAPFLDFFQDQAMKETRTFIFQPNNEHGIPAGAYSLIESYCTDLDCDCRNVYILVYNTKTKATEAMISYGWEPMQFYMDWMGTKDKNDEMLKYFKGPDLIPMSISGPYADTWLKIFKDLIRTDKEYKKRLQRHYHQVKDVIQKKQ